MHGSLDVTLDEADVERVDETETVPVLVKLEVIESVADVVKEADADEDIEVDAVVDCEVVRVVVVLSEVVSVVVVGVVGGQ